jgi:Domain of unknown function (DUF5916)
MGAARLTPLMSARRVLSLAILTSLPMLASPVLAQTPVRGETYAITRAKGPITIDGNLSDEGWRDALRVERWYETDPGDNIEPPVKSVGFLTFDDKYLYAAFEFDDPNPKAIIAPFGDHDGLTGRSDYGGIWVDPRNDGHTAYEFLVTAHNVQYDAVLDDSSGENSSPDFFWQSAARIHDHGWTLEMRIPFSSLRYRNVNPQTWGIVLQRSYSRDFRHQILSVKVPRGSQCLVCREGSLVGLSNLPSGRHLVAAPYVSGSKAAHSSGDIGSPLVADPFDRKIGLDVKYTPNADNVFDGTIRPDFSQIESDTAQISTNQRFALFFPEKRPFFLEGVELFSTPIQAVYTRTITDPDWGARSTGKLGGVNYTALVARDAGGGSIVVPGSNSSSLAAQDFQSTVFVGRAKKDRGLSFVSFLMTDRESGSDGHNRVFGPDFQWRVHGTETVVGQLLVSDTTTPNRPDVNAAWTGASLRSAASSLNWNHNTEHYDASAGYKDFGSGFRADNGFVPQVGYREEYAETGWTFRPKGFFSRVRPFVNIDNQVERDGGGVIDRTIRPGANMDMRWNGFLIAQFSGERVRAGSQTFPRHQLQFYQRISPSRLFQQVGVDGNFGSDVDFENVRPGRGGSLNFYAALKATDHLAIEAIANTTWLHVDDAAGVSQPLFTARVQRVKATYTFTARSFVRLIGQYQSTDRDPALYLQPVAAEDGHFSGTALFAYKINWQSVMFVGYGDDRELTDQRRLVRTGHQVFIKVSYAFQR